jgi:4'-phosphopantetheinyl transferase
MGQGEDFADPPAGALPMGDAEVHVWRARLDLAASGLCGLARVLDADERARAARFVFDVDRNRFIARRGILRLILARYLGVMPAGITLKASEYGKPSLADSHRTNLRFNLSHSHDVALYAMTRARDLGVDVEYIRPGLAEDSIAERFFAAGEVAALRALPQALQPAAFFDCWTRKEAFVKAKGMGLSLALDSFEVSLGDAGPARLVRTSPDPGEAARWTMAALHPAPNYAAALVVAARSFELRCWNWSCRDGAGNLGLGES